MYKCKYCGKEYDTYKSLGAHISSCKLNPNYEINKEKRKGNKNSKEKMKISRIINNPYKFLKKEHILICQRCGKEYKLNLTDKEYESNKYSKFCSRSCANSRGPRSEEVKQKIKETLKSTCYIPPKKTYIKYCKYCGKEMIFEGSKNFHLYCSNECKHNSLSLKRGGFREGSVKNYKSGWYKGIHCDSSWELAFVIYHLDHNINIERCKEKRKYILDNKELEYHPDFIVENIIYEIKGIKSKNSDAKQLYNPDIIFLYRNNMKKYLDYVINKYGKNFIDLYDKKDKIRSLGLHGVDA